MEKSPHATTCGQPWKLSIRYAVVQNLMPSLCGDTDGRSDFQNAGMLIWPGGRSSVAGRPRSFWSINHKMTWGVGQQQRSTACKRWFCLVPGIQIKVTYQNWRSIAISCLTWLTVMQYDKMHFENVLCSAQTSFLDVCRDNPFYHIASLCNSAINVGQYQRIWSYPWFLI